MPIDKFYQTNNIEQTAHSLCAEITIEPRHEIFEGHFPGQPVVPGVCMVAIAKELLEQGLGKKLRLRKAPQIKFLKVLVPTADTPIKVTTNWVAENNGYTIQASIIDEAEAAVFKMNGFFEVVA
ncbi:MAG: 3-hydroxyacyl-ACP dehydratase [Edaphocola sp.]